jgi:N-acetylneuraminic acid mutarotase
MRFDSQKIILFGILCLSTCIFRCGDEKIASRANPSIDTDAVSDINDQGATLNGEILQMGKSSISDHGFVYGPFNNPDFQTAERISLGEAKQAGPIHVLANRNLTAGTKYYVRAYATAPGQTGTITVFGQGVEFVSKGSSAPEIKDFSPKSASIGDTIVINGTGFSNIIRNNFITIGATQAEVFKSKPDSIWCIVGQSTPVGAQNLTLTIGQRVVSASSKFTLKAIIIGSFTPSVLTFLDTLTITGSNFPRNGTLYVLAFNNAMTPIKATRTMLKVIIPYSATIPETPPSIYAGAQTVPAATDLQLFAPTLSSFSPQSGTKDTQVTLTGNYFNPIYTANLVQLAGKDLVGVSSSRTTITVKLPSGIAPGTYPFKISIGGRTITSASQFEIIKPEISSIAPLTGTWGTTVTINGQNFGATTAANVVKFGNATATVISASPTQLQVTVPPALVTKNSTISVNAVPIDNQTTSFASPFVLAAPQITTISPANGKTAAHITITGTNFSPIPGNHVVRFGSLTATVLSSTSTQLVVSVPPGMADGDVSVDITAAEQNVVSGSNFHVIAPWKRVADLPGSTRYEGIGFTAGNYGFVGTGFESSNITKNIYRYDPVSNVWNQQTTYTIPSFGTTSSYVNFVSFTDGTYVYAGLGNLECCVGPHNQMRRYDPVANTWSDIASIGVSPNEGLEGAVAYSINGKGYVTTGRNRQNVTSFVMWSYDPVTDTWARKADLPSAGRWEATGFSINSLAYIVGGTSCYCDAQFRSDVWQYDATNDRWQQLRNFPGTPRSKATSFAINGTAYLVGGLTDTYVNGAAMIGDAWKYDPPSDTWTRLEDFPGERRFGAVAFIINGKAYFGSGIGPSLNTHDFWEFDPSKL